MKFIYFLFLFIFSLNSCQASSYGFSNNPNYEWLWSNDEVSCYIEPDSARKISDNILSVRYGLDIPSREAIALVDEQYDIAANTFTITSGSYNFYRYNYIKGFPADQLNTPFDIRPGTMHEALYKKTVSLTKGLPPEPVKTNHDPFQPNPKDK